MKLLTVSDKEVSLIYSPQIRRRFEDVDLAVSCGDLSYYYLEYIVSSLDIPLYYVRGNHAKAVEYGCAGPREAPWGAVDLHRKVVYDSKSGLLMAGIEGSLRYNKGPHQYTQPEMWSMVLQLVPALLWNKLRYGRYLDVFVTHAPPWGIHDQNDRAHQGVKAFNWLIKTFQPTLHIHGHIHVYTPMVTTETMVGNTMVLNTFGYRKLNLPGKTELQTVS
ncbi:MAG: metallophosphoesterase [Chloroflexota bacterium]|nr:metallophosphoesterase [Chloroflexota bacterium]